MRAFFLLSGLGIFACHTATYAQQSGSGNWIEIAHGNSGVVISVDPARVQRTSTGTLRAWLRWDWPTDQSFEETRFRRRLNQSEVDCTLSRMRSLQDYLYTAAGEVAQSFTESTPWADIVPETVNEMVQVELCSAFGPEGSLTAPLAPEPAPATRSPQVASPPTRGSGLCESLRGASIIADDGTFLGLIASRYESRSILNEYGTHGSRYAGMSIWNEYGRYGGAYSTLSPFNRYTSTPPAIVRDGQVIGYLTINRAHAGAVNPALLSTCEY